MSNIKELYQDIIISHQKDPKNFGQLDHPTHCCKKSNPICGDEIEVQIALKSEIIEQISFHGYGCALCIASTSMMTELVSQKRIADFKQAFVYLKRLLDPKSEFELNEKYKILSPFSGVKKFPTRTKCVELGWQTLDDAIHKS